LRNLQVHHPHQQSYSLIEYSPAIGSFSYHHRYAQFAGQKRLMKLTTIFLLTIISFSVSGQGLTGKYNAYNGHSLELKSDSTFRYEWRFDLASSWTVGQWRASNGIVYLNFKNVYDTLTREDKPDSLALSSDEKSNRINIEEFAIGQISGGGQGRRIDRITDRLAIRGKRLYLMSKAGQVLRTKESGILDKKKRPTYYFKVD
jgi:hypothetical protein